MMNIEPLLKTEIPIRGVPFPVTLRIPTAAQMLVTIHEPAERTEEIMEPVFVQEIHDLIATVGGRGITLDEAREIYYNVECFGAILHARNRLYQALAEQGRLFAHCPHCSASEIELDMVVLTLALRDGPWSIIDGGLFIALPSLAEERPRGKRPAGVPTAKQLRFATPSGRGELGGAISGGVLGDIDHDREREILAGREGSQVDRRLKSDTPGGRAAARLCAALESIDGVEGDINLEILNTMRAPDFFYLDNLFYLTHNVDVAEGSRMIMKCPGCGESFLPVR